MNDGVGISGLLDPAKLVYSTGCLGVCLAAARDAAALLPVPGTCGVRCATCHPTTEYVCTMMDGGHCSPVASEFGFLTQTHLSRAFFFSSPSPTSRYPAAYKRGNPLGDRLFLLDP